MLKRKRDYDEFENQLRNIEFQKLILKFDDNSHKIFRWLEQFIVILDTTKFNLVEFIISLIGCATNKKRKEVVFVVFTYFLEGKILQKIHITKFYEEAVKTTPSELLWRCLKICELSLIDVRRIGKFFSDDIYLVWRNSNKIVQKCLESLYWFRLLTGFVNCTSNTDDCLTFIKTTEEKFDPDYFDFDQQHKCTSKKTYKASWFAIDKWCWPANVHNDFLPSARIRFEKYRKEQNDLLFSILPLAHALSTIVTDYLSRPTDIHICE